MQKKEKEAREKFLEGYNCAQAVLYAFCDELGITRDEALKLSCGFGGGMGRAEEVCGALSAGVIAIGKKYGRGERDAREATYVTYEKTKELLTRFAALHTSYLCRELISGCDPEKPKERKELCARYVESSVRILEALL
jgi:C_GCAxxG_C_C family probable redox protein